MLKLVGFATLFILILGLASGALDFYSTWSFIQKTVLAIIAFFTALFTRA